ncbi:sensor histidine kinase [Sphingomonas sp. MG17]|uniref:histidine kinase n=1 Tax=Sphingomonas tagetis TaxID=2949092 RepID=A0A9X2HJV1_9SPHN|nr:sensor histidine kinase [Sphingomonas tagetis]MCP3732218.1 sensor histidine kinase [Sphingomonas tagetis]
MKEREELDATRPIAGEAPLLLSEMHHRVANEIASAIAAMRLAQGAGLTGPRITLFDRAIERLEGFGQVHEVLAARSARTIDFGAELQRLTSGIVKGRDGLDGATVRLTARGAVLPGGPARRLLLVAAELMYNGIRHALSGRRGSLWIDVDRDEDFVTLVVSDDGPGLAGPSCTSGTGLGSGIVAELVRKGDGRIECDTSRHGTTFRVTLPLAGPATIDWLLPEAEA